MQYRTFGNTGELVSALGFGTMRLPLENGEQGSSSYGHDQVDFRSSIHCIRHAIDHGVNYVDTAYNYLGGKSEQVVGQALRDGYRDKVFLATKSPTWMLKSRQDFSRILREQLQKLQTDHIDMYLLHTLTDQYVRDIVEPFHLFEAMQEAKEAGLVRYIGFSFHDELPVFERIVDAADWDFCQIQLNYVDTEHQAGLTGLQYAADRGLAVSIMEPLRGGYLVNPPEEARKEIEATGKSPVEFALDFLWSLPEVSTVLSGMGTIAQLNENLDYAARARIGGFTDAERLAAQKAKACIYDHNQIGCTGCRYCEGGCPAGVPISQVFRCFYNYTNANDDAAKNAYRELRDQYGANANDCLGCGACEQICPQHIAIPQWLKKADVLLR